MKITLSNHSFANLQKKTHIRWFKSKRTTTLIFILEREKYSLKNKGKKLAIKLQISVLFIEANFENGPRFSTGTNEIFKRSKAT